MRYLVISAVFPLVTIVLYAGEPETPELELFVQQKNVQSSDSITYTITAQGPMWDGDLNVTTHEDLRESSVTVHGTVDSDRFGWNCVKNGMEERYEDYALAKYKFQCSHSSEYFYIDFSDDRHCNVYPDTAVWDPDVTIFYDASTETFSWCNTNDCNETSITNGSTIKIWEMNDSAPQVTIRFQPTNPTNLAITNSGGHPKLTWEKSMPREHAEYLVYRKGSSITPLSISDTTYLDEDVTIGSGGPISYKIRAIHTDGTKYSPGYSNEETVNGMFIEKLAVGSTLSGDSFALLPAWPNPFNPTTTIEYALPQAGFVTLRVYNPLGEEVAALVEGEQLAGRYTATWDASRVPSGVYFYRLTAGGYAQTRKLLLMR